MKYTHCVRATGLFLAATVLLGIFSADAQECATCGQEELNSSLAGCIKSPEFYANGSHSYPPNLDCRWYITFPYPYVRQMQITITKMDLYCNMEEYLSYEYLGQDLGVRNRWCEMPDPANVTSSMNTKKLNTNHTMLKFHSAENLMGDVRNRTGFQITYQAICDDSDTPYDIDNYTTEIHPPRHSVLAECKYKWRISDPGKVPYLRVAGMSEKDSEGVWRASGAEQEQEQEVNLSSIFTCLPFNDVIVTYTPAKGYTQDTYLRIERGDKCKDACSSNPCQNGGTCNPVGDTFKCICPSSYSGNSCEDRDDEEHCKKERDSYPESGIDWSNTVMGETDVQPCPNATGNATRPCLIVDSIGQWGQPDLSGCVSQLFADIYDSARLLSNAQHVEKSAILNITSALKLATTGSSNNRLFAGDLNAATTTLQTVSTLVGKTILDNDGLQEIAKGYGDAVGNIVDPSTSTIWRFTHTGYLENRLTALFESTETLSASIGVKLSQVLSRKDRRSVVARRPYYGVVVTSANLDFEIRMFDRDSDLSSTEFGGQSTASEIILPHLVFQRAVQRTSNTFIHLYTAKFNSISELLQQTYKQIEQRDNSTLPVINSEILSSKVLNVNEDAFSSLTEPVKLVFRLQNSSLSKTLHQTCVFLNMSSTTAENRWLMNGCQRSESESNESCTVCYCNHLTNFAVLMDVYGTEESIDEFNSKILTYLSYGGGALSILGCVIAVIVFEFFRLKNERVRIHEQLALTIILVQIFFLVGIDRTENRHVCMAMAICLHYFLVAMFCWMLVEGAHLYLVLVKVFQSRSHMKKYVAIGWGIPLVVVGISAGIFHDDYGAGSICWLSRKVLLVAFVPAVGLVIVINTIVLLIVMRIMMTSLTKGSKASSEDKSSVRIGLKAASVLLPLLGLTWTFGFLSITSKETLIFTYLFTLFNSTQGVFFFVFHCLLSVDVQNAYDRRSRRLSQLKQTQSSISKLHSRKSSYSGDSSKHSTLMTEIASTLERRRSNRNSYNSIGRPQSVTFDDDVFLPDGTHMSRGSSVHSNGSRTSFRDIVRSSPIPGHEKVEDYRNAVLNNKVKSNGSVSSDGYLFYYGKEKNSLKEMGLHDYDKNQIYAKVNK